MKLSAPQRVPGRAGRLQVTSGEERGCHDVTEDITKWMIVTLYSFVNSKLKNSLWQPSVILICKINNSLALNPVSQWIKSYKIRNLHEWNSPNRFEENLIVAGQDLPGAGRVSGSQKIDQCHQNLRPGPRGAYEDKSRSWMQLLQLGKDLWTWEDLWIHRTRFFCQAYTWWGVKISR